MLLDKPNKNNQNKEAKNGYNCRAIECPVQLQDINTFLLKEIRSKN